MNVVSLHDKARLEAFFGHSPALHAYALGDLDDREWPYTQWYGLQDTSGALREVALLYTAPNPPVLQAITEHPEQMCTLLTRLLPLLPARLFLHLSPGLRPALASHYSLYSPETHLKMVLRDPRAPLQIPIGDTVRLAPADADSLRSFYDQACPGHWFTPRALETGPGFGVYRQGEWVCAAGVHVYSPAGRVAALGNVVTHPAFRGQGLATQVCAALCRALLETCDTIGLNVQQDNAPALACYRSLGFAEVATYEEMTATRKLP